MRIDEVGSGAFDFVANPGDVTVRRVYLGPPPGSTRIFSGGGGAMSFYSRGKVTVEDCDFSRIDDDGFNLGTHTLRVVGKVNQQSCLVESWPGDFVVGDTISLWDWQTKAVRAEAKLTAAQKEKDGRWLIHYDHPMEILRTGPGDPQAPFAQQMADVIDRIVDLESAGSCVLRRNKISSMRARCFLVKTGHSVIEDNFLYDTHMPGIVAGPEFFWGEGPQLRGLVIRRNVFRHIDAPNISVATFDSPTGSENKDVTIEGNTFENYGRLPVIYMPHVPQGVAILVRNTDGVTIKDNYISPPQSPCPGINPVVVQSCKNVHLNP